MYFVKRKQSNFVLKRGYEREREKYTKHRTKFEDNLKVIKGYEKGRLRKNIQDWIRLG